MRRAQKQRQTRRRIIVGVVMAAVVVGLALLTGVFKSDKAKTKTSSSSSSTTAPASASTTAAPAGKVGSQECPAADGSSPQTRTFDGEPKMCIDANKTYTATMETDVGTIKIALDPKRAPKTVNNFVVLARYHFFDGLTFHRVIPGFVDQGGDPQGTGQGGPGYQFADELPKQGDYKLGSLAMANSGPNTNGSQFFIITGDQGVSLPPNYSLFGQVTEGLDVAKKIEADGDNSGTPKVIHKTVKVTIQES